MAQIKCKSIDQAISEIYDSFRSEAVFSITFTNMDGELRHYPRARYGAPDSHIRKEKLDINKQLAASVQVKKPITMKHDGTIPITNLENGKFKTIKWFGIRELNNEKVR